MIDLFFIENKCLYNEIQDLKREGNKVQEGGFELGSIASKRPWHTLYLPLELMNYPLFYNVDYPNHTLVGGVTVNSLCQQGGLIALSVNKTLLENIPTVTCKPH